MSQKVTLYGAPMSMFTGKARAYLRKHSIAFDEVMPGHASYGEKIFLKTKRGIVPVIELPGGELIQDTVDIIDHFENAGLGKFSVYPETPILRVAALIIDFFGSEGLFKVAMHYRWNFPEQNEAFLRMEFGDHIVPGADQSSIGQMADKVMEPMKAYLPALGVDDTTIPTIEAQYLELLSLLNAHFAEHPFLLGGLPSVADYGLMAPLYAHLSRDPYPGAIMKQKAQRVYRWVERMNAENVDSPEYPDYPQTYFADDQLPDTLLAILRLIASDFLPEIQQAVVGINQWLNENPDCEGQCVTAKPRIKALTMMKYPFRGVTVQAIVMPYQLYMLQRITDFYESCDEATQRRLDNTYAPLQLGEFLTLQGQRRVERPQFIEVWGKEL